MYALRARVCRMRAMHPSALMLLDVLQPYLLLRCPCDNDANDAVKGDDVVDAAGGAAVTFQWEVLLRVRVRQIWWICVYAYMHTCMRCIAPFGNKIIYVCMNIC